MLPAQHTTFNTLDNWAIKTPPNQKGPERKGYRVMARNMYMLLSWCLMSSDVIWHIRDKLWPMPKHGSIRKVHACLAVTCHLHFWQNDRDFLRATVVTRGWNGYRNRSQHRKSTLEKKILPPFQQGFEPATFQSRVRRSNHWAIPTPRTCIQYTRLHIWGESYHGQLGSLLRFCDCFLVLIDSLVCWCCTGALGLVLS